MVFTMNIGLGILAPNHSTIVPIAVCNLIKPVLLIQEKPHYLTYHNSNGFPFYNKLWLSV